MPAPTTTPPGARGLGAASPAAPALRVSRRHLCPHQPGLRLHPQHTLPPATRHGRAIPQPPGVAWRGHRVAARQPEPLAPASACEAGGRPGPGLLDRCQGTGPRTLGLRLARGPMDPTPHTTRALGSASPPGQPLAHVHPLTRSATLATRALHGGGLHPRVRDPVRRPQALPPAAGTPRLRAPHHGGACGETQAAVGLGHRVEHARRVRRCDPPCARRLTMARGATALPGLCTPCTGEQPPRLSGAPCGILLVAGRWGPPRLSPPWGSGVRFWKSSGRTAVRLWNQPASIVSIRTLPTEFVTIYRRELSGSDT